MANTTKIFHGDIVIQTGSLLRLEDGAEFSGSIIPRTGGKGSIGTGQKPFKDAFLSSGSLFIDGRKAVSFDETAGRLTFGGPNNEDVLINASGSGKVIITNELEVPSGSVTASTMVVTTVVSPGGGAATGSLFGTASFADRAQAAPVAIMLHAGADGVLEIRPESSGSIVEFDDALRILVDLTGFKDARLVANVTNVHTQDVYMAIQYSFDRSLTQPASSWSFLDGVNGPSARSSGSNNLGIRTDEWTPITGSAKTEVVLRAVSSGSTSDGRIDIGTFALFLR